ncbi:MAG: hypothetical protein IJ412_08770 [Oscillospiraceae bacterium]|nr:hypothetical protein [Oscillospiraceae bacterium]
MCNDTFSKILAFIGALVLGILVAVLYFTGVIVTLPIIAYIGLGAAIGILVFLLLVLFGADRGWRCVCRYASPLLYASVLAIAAAALLLAVASSGGIILLSILAGVWATLLFFAVILFLMFVSCFIASRCGCNAPAEHRGNDCRCGGEPHCSNGSCRFN